MFNTASALLGPGHCVQMFIQACWLLADNTLQHPQEEKKSLKIDALLSIFEQLVGHGKDYAKFAGWQKLREATKGLRQKVWTRTKILSPNIRYFVAIL